MTKIAAAVLLMYAAPVLAQQAPMPMPMGLPVPVCPRDAQPLPAALAGWNDRTPLVAATDAATLGGATLAPGRAADVALAETRAVRYAVAPSHPAATDSRGGMAAFTVAKAGRYRVAIGSAVWLDVVAGGAALASVGHGHGPDCTGVRKMVDFELQPGAYLLQIAGSGDAHVPVLIVRLN